MTPHRRSAHTAPTTRSAVSYAVAVALSGLATAGWALPTGEAVVGGAATVNRNGNAMVINQTTAQAALNWQSFNIGAAESVTFVQPSASSVALNRVIGSDPSSIFGRLSANGQIYLLNPNGIVFGSGARVDVGSLIATTLGISTADFMAGKRTFINAGNAGVITNQGVLNSAKGGYIALIAPQVTNSGTINTPGGTVALAAGERVTLDIRGDNLIGLSVDAAALKAQIEHSGVIDVGAGQVFMSARSADALLPTVINSTGIVVANSLTERGGRIFLDGGEQGTVSVTGTLQAKSDAQQGGEIKVLGQHARLVGKADIDASGATGGGTVLVGGNYQGTGPERNAETTYVGADVTIKANAIDNGNGGKVVVWADNSTASFGSVSARGGAASGDGGSIEVSGKKTLTLDGSLDTGASNGKPGEVLLDPQDVQIVTTVAAAGDVSATTISNTLATSNLTLQSANPGLGGTLGSITVNAPISWSGVGNLTLQASNDFPLLANAGGAININSSITSTGTGTLTATGGNGGSGGAPLLFSNGGSGGSINVAAAIQAQQVTLTAGKGGNGTTTGFAGGSGGSVSVSASITTKTLLSITAGQGGNGGNGEAPGTPTNGAGGVGGAIDVSGSLSSTSGNITLQGGKGGSSGLNGTNVNAGSGGNVSLSTAPTAVTSISGNVVLAAGAAGGNGGTSGDLRGTFLSVDTGGNITLNSSISTANTNNISLLAGANNGVLTLSDATKSTTGLSAIQGKGNVSLRASGLNVNGAVGSTPIAPLGTVTLDAGTGALTLGAQSNVSGNTVTLKAGTAISQSTPTIASTASIASNVLEINAGGNVDLNNGFNRAYNGGTIVTLAANLSAGSFNYVGKLSTLPNETASPPLVSIGTAGATTGIRAPGGISITAGNGGNSTVGVGPSGGTISVGAALTTNGDITLQAGNGGNSTPFFGGPFAGGAGGDVSLATGITTGTGSIRLIAGNGGQGSSGQPGANPPPPSAGGAGGRGGQINLGADTKTNLATPITSTSGNITLTAGSGGAGGPQGFGSGPGAVGVAGIITGVNGSGVQTDISVTTGGNVAINSNITGITQGTFISQANVTLKAGKNAGNTITYQNITSSKSVLIEGRTINNTTTVQGVTGVTLDAGTSGSVTNTGTLTNGGGANTGVIALNGGTVNLGGTLTTGAGRFLTYTPDSKGLITTGGFTGLSLYGRTFAANAPASITQTGNRFIYANTPTLTVTATGPGITYGDALPAFTTSVTGLINGDTAANAFSGAAAASVNGKNTGTAATSANGINAGSQPIAVTQGTLASDMGYAFTFTPGALTITQKALNAQITGNPTKGYDGTTAATLTPANYNVTGLVGTESVTVTQTVGAYNSKDRSGTPTGAEFVSATLAAGNFTAGGGTLLSNYFLPTTALGKGTITAATLKAAIIGNPTRAYDGTTAATLASTNYSLTGLAAGDSFTVSQTNGTYNTKDVLTANTVTTTLAAGNFTAVGGTLAANYVLPTTASGAGAITPKALTATVAAPNKVYDGTTTATPTLTITSGLVGTETVTATGTATFNTKDVATAKTVTVNTTALANGTNGGLSTNYSLAAGQTVPASITPKALTATVTAPNKEYDGTTTATPTLTITSGLVGTETVTATGTATFNTKDVATAKTVTVNTTALANGTNGGLSANYSLAAGQTVAASITPKALTGSISVLNSNRGYDGTTAATITTRTLTGVITGDNVTYVGGTANYSDKNVGNSKTVTATGLSLAGPAATNYTVNTTATTLANITPATLTVTYAGVNRVYDTTTNATVTTTDNRFGTDVLTINRTAAFADKNVGNGKAVNVTGVSLTGTDAANYTVAATGATTANITPAALAVVANAGQGKNVNAPDPVLTFTTTGLLGNDTLAGVLARAAGETAGTYPINIGTLGNPNYIIAFTGANFTITGGSGPVIPFFNPDANGPQGNTEGQNNPNNSPTINISNPGGPLGDTGVVIIEGGQRLPSGVQ